MICGSSNERAQEDQVSRKSLWVHWGGSSSDLQYHAVFFHSRRVDGVLNQLVSVRQSLDLLVIVGVIQYPYHQFIRLCLNTAGDGFFDHSVNVAPGLFRGT